MRSKLEGEIKVLKEQIHSAEGNEEHLQNRIRSISEQLSERDKERDAILADKKETDDKLSALEEERMQARELLEQTQREIEELNNNIENGKNTIIDALNNRATIKSKLGRFDTMFEQVNIRKAELNSRLLRAKSDEAGTDRDHQEAGRRI